MLNTFRHQIGIEIERCGVSCHFPAEQLFQEEFVGAKFLQNLRFLCMIEIRMGIAVAGDLMACINTDHLVLRDPADGHAAFMFPGKALPHQTVIEIKGSLQSVFVQKLNKADILDNAVIVADIKGLLFSAGI